MTCLFPEVFKGLGTFPGKPYHINIDPSVPPKRIPPRSVPVHQQELFKEKLNEMLEQGVIVPVTESTPWISSFVITESTDKDGKPKLRKALTQSQ